MYLSFYILAVNLGSTSSKIAVYLDEESILNETIRHPIDELLKFDKISDQKEYRENAILEKLTEKGINLNSIDVIATRGGNTKPIPSGIYGLNEKMLNDIMSEKYGSHPSNLSCLISYNIGERFHVPVIAIDPPTTDEFCNLARYSGLKEIPRRSSFHALNQKSTARKIAARLGKSYDEVNFIVAHIGGGISIGAHERGKVIDANNALHGEGPFSAERAGSLPTGYLVEMCFSGKCGEEEIVRLIRNQSGLISYLGTSSGLEVVERINHGDKYALEVYEAMAYQISKEISSMAAVLKGNIDGIILTGSFANSSLLVDFITERVSFLGPIYLSPGENEMETLRDSALRYLNGIEELAVYA